VHVTGTASIIVALTAMVRTAHPTKNGILVFSKSLRGEKLIWTDIISEERLGNTYFCNSGMMFYTARTWGICFT
jgi:hypothetical protein